MNERQQIQTQQPTGLSISSIRSFIEHSHWLALGCALPLAVALFFAPTSAKYLAANGTIGIPLFVVLVLAWRLRSLSLHISGPFFIMMCGHAVIDRAFPSQPLAGYFAAVVSPFFVTFALFTVLRSSVYRFTRISDERIG